MSVAAAATAVTVLATPAFDEVRVTIRDREAAACLPPSVATLVQEGLRVSVESEQAVTAAHRARFAAVLTSRLEASVPFCRAYAAAITTVASSWLRTQVAQPSSAFEAYCQRELGDSVGALALTFDDPLLRCLREGMRVALLFPDTSDSSSQ